MLNLWSLFLAVTALSGIYFVMLKNYVIKHIFKT